MHRALLSLVRITFTSFPFFMSASYHFFSPRLSSFLSLSFSLFSLPVSVVRVTVWVTPSPPPSPLASMTSTYGTRGLGLVCILHIYRRIFLVLHGRTFLSFVPYHFIPLRHVVTYPSDSLITVIACSNEPWSVDNPTIICLSYPYYHIPGPTIICHYPILLLSYSPLHCLYSPSLSFSQIP